MPSLRDHRATVGRVGAFWDNRLVLFASPWFPALAVGLHWQGATRRGIAILAGLVITLALELRLIAGVHFPAGVTASAVAWVVFLVFFRSVVGDPRPAQSAIDPDVRLVMDRRSGSLRSGALGANGGVGCPTRRS